MKLSNRHLRNQKLELSMTSMIDVVFLLLIFFLVTTSFIRPEREIPSAIQVQEKEANQANQLLEPAIVDVLLFSKTPTFRLGGLQTSEIESIEKLLSGFPNKSEGAFVRVDGDVPYEAAAKAIGACRSAGFSSVSYLPLER